MNPKVRILLAFTGLLLTYGIAYGLDRGTLVLRSAVSQAQVSPYASLGFWASANLVLALCVLALYTWVFPGLPRWALIVIAVIGLLVDFIPVLYWLPLGAATLYLIQLLAFIRGYLFSAGAWTAVAGVFTLVRRRTGTPAG